jgi:hypothetical protein
MFHHIVNVLIELNREGKEFGLSRDRSRVLRLRHLADFIHPRIILLFVSKTKNDDVLVKDSQPMYVSARLCYT